MSECHLQPQLVHPTLLFVNPASGGGLGLELMETLQNTPNLYFVQLPSEQDTWSLKYENIVHDKNLRVAVAGGDGTLNWVVTLLSTFYGITSDCKRPPLAIIPFGTGNDMSRSLGWGKSMSRSNLCYVGRLIENISTSKHMEDVDVWSVVVRRTDTGESTKHQMINYISFGQDAAITGDYANIRKVAQPFLCGSCASKSLFVPAGALNIFGHRSLNDYIKAGLMNMDTSGILTPSKLVPESSDKTLVIQSSQTIYGGRTLWRGSTPASMNDGKLEVMLEGGLIDLIFNNVGLITARPYGQAEGAKVEASAPCYYQIDGEGMMTKGPATFDVTRIGSYPLLFAE